MNPLELASPAAATSTEQNLMVPNSCLDDCYLVELLKESSHPALIISRLPLSLMLVVFSGLTILVTLRTTRLAERPSAILVTSLGVSGALIGIIISVITALQQSVSMPFRAVVVLLVVLPRILHLVTIFTLTWLTLERYLALCMPLRYNAVLTEDRCYVLVAASWVVPVLLLGFTCLYGDVFSQCTDIRPYLVTYLLLFISASAAIVVMYSLIAREFCRPVEGAFGGQDIVTVGRRTAKELMVVVIVNLILATPDVAMKMYLLNCPKTLPVLYHVTPQLLLVHLLCFYPLNAWKSSDFRKGMLDTCASFKNYFVRVLSRMCCRRSFSQVASVEVSFAKLSAKSSSTVSSGVENPTPSIPSIGDSPS